MIHFFHKWTKWVTVAEGPIIQKRYATNSELTVGYWKRQERTCSECGKTEMNREESR